MLSFSSQTTSQLPNMLFIPQRSFMRQSSQQNVTSLHLSDKIMYPYTKPVICSFPAFWLLNEFPFALLYISSKAF